jgi:hypothetical protein
MTRLAALAVLLVITLPALAGASPAFDGPTLYVAPLPRDGQVLVSFKLGDVFTPEVESAIHSGLTISFVYNVDLMRGSAAWFDRTIASAVVVATVRYDNLSRRYHLTRTLDGRMERAETIDREEQARDWLTTDFERLALFQSVKLEANGEYYVRVRAHTTPRNAIFLWPWDRHDVTGLAKFTSVR